MTVEANTTVGSLPVLTSCDIPLAPVSSFKDHGRVLSASYENFTEVVCKLKRARLKWSWLTRLLRREGSYYRTLECSAFLWCRQYCSMGQRCGMYLHKECIRGDGIRQVWNWQGWGQRLRRRNGRRMRGRRTGRRCRQSTRWDDTIETILPWVWSLIIPYHMFRASNSASRLWVC